MRVFFVQRPTLPIVVVQLVSPRGAAHQPHPGMGSFMGAMLEQGTFKRSALEISDAYLDIGAEHNAWVGWDSTNVMIQVLPEKLQRGIEIMADVFRNPSFPTSEVDRVRSETQASIRQHMDQPRILVSNTVARTLYAGHPYGESLVGTEASLGRVTSAGLKAFHRSTVIPQESFVVVVGNTTQSELTEYLEAAFVDWRGADQPPKQIKAPAPVARKIRVIERKGAEQSNIAVAAVGVPRSTESFDAILMGNAVFGGMFSSRLNTNLREKHGYTYGAYSSFDMRQGPGPFSARAAVDAPNTGAALKEVLNELVRFCSSPPEAAELSLALGQEVTSLPGLFESFEATANVIAALGVYGKSPDEFRQRPGRLRAITPGQVQTVAARYFDPNKMQIVVVGDLDSVLPQLEELKFGPIEVVDAVSSKVIRTIPLQGQPLTFSCAGP